MGSFMKEFSCTRRVPVNFRMDPTVKLRLDHWIAENCPGFSFGRVMDMVTTVFLKADSVSKARARARSSRSNNIQ